VMADILEQRGGTRGEARPAHEGTGLGSTPTRASARSCARSGSPTDLFSEAIKKSLTWAAR